MRKQLAWLVAALAIGIVALAPSDATAGRGWRGGPGIGVAIGPSYCPPYVYGGYYGYRYRPYAYPYANYGYRYRPYGYSGYRYRPAYGYGRYYGNRGYVARRAYRRWR